MPSRHALALLVALATALAGVIPANAAQADPGRDPGSVEQRRTDTPGPLSIGVVPGIPGLALLPGLTGRAGMTGRAPAAELEAPQEPQETRPHGRADAPDRGAQQPERPPLPSPKTVLGTAERVLAGDGKSDDPGPSAALLNLQQVLGRLSEEDRAQAYRLLARPDDAAPAAAGHRPGNSKWKKRCTDDVCLRWRPKKAKGRTQHEATKGEARKAYRVIKKVWKNEIDRLGYREPLPDGRPGNDDRVDVYLQDLANADGSGFYGYAVAEASRKRSPGYLVLENDFAEFDHPGRARRATGAHEFFHLAQYAYDSYEDPWFMEATATWIEERVYDAADDNRQFLPHGQLHQSQVPLDRFAGSAPYGNWIWFEYLSTTWSRWVVRRAWALAGRKHYSLSALRTVLDDRGGGLEKNYARFAGDNTSPAAVYPEGDSYDRPEPTGKVRLGADDRKARRTFRVDHLASKTWRVIPRDSLTGDEWRLRVRVDGPRRRTSPQVAVTVLTDDGKVHRHLVKLGKKGRGKRVATFDASRVQDVSVSAVNASSRYECHRGTFNACSGEPKDDNRRFQLVVRAFRG